MKSLSLRRMKNAGLPNIWSQFLMGPYNEKVRTTSLQLIMLFVGSKDAEIRRLGYRLSLLYAKHTGDSSIIHSIASMTGLVPVSKISESKNQQFSESFVSTLRDSFAESLKEGEIYLTVGQKELKETFLNQTDALVSVVAPTSYGKSSLICDYLKMTSGNFCVVVPTKSLLAQTRKMLLHQLGEQELDYRKIITHHEMYSEGDKNVIAVLTQERLLRLLQKEPDLTFEHLVIDESHNLFENDSRSRALASTILIALHRNPSARIKFLSPFIVDSNSLISRLNRIEISHVSTNEYVKSELIYYIDFRAVVDIPRNQLFVFDQFMNKAYQFQNSGFDSPFDYLFQQAGRKNIIYVNRPKNTHDIARKLLDRLDEVRSEKIQQSCKDLGEYLHKDYFLVSCLRKGVIFHHGSVPDNVRLFLEQLYSDCDEIRFVITTSTLLEGVNLPAEKMFLFDIKKGHNNLSSSQLKNLIGRVSRFKEVFAQKNISALMPQIHFVGNDCYPGTTKNIGNYICEHLAEGRTYKDKVENPLLESSDLSEINISNGLIEELTFLGNSEEGVLQNTEFQFHKPKTELGRLCYVHRIADFNVLDSEMPMDRRAQELKRLGVQASNATELIEAVNEIFLKNLPDEGSENDNSISRLRNNFKARDFYAMILEWRTSGTPYQVMISRFIGYWKKIESDPISRIVYAGNWGNRARTLDARGENYIDIGGLSHSERVTLAIARIESEMSFLDYNVMRYVECLSDLELIAPEYADRLKYGSSDPSIKELILAGMSYPLAQLIVTKNLTRYLIHFPSGAIGLNLEVLRIMENSTVNSILINEAKYHTR